MATAPGSTNAESYHVDGVKALSKQSDGVRLGFGAATNAVITSGAITLKSSNMLLYAPGGGSATLNMISGGEDGEVVMLRADSAATSVTVVSTGNIRLASTVNAHRRPAGADAAAHGKRVDTGRPDRVIVGASTPG